MNSFIFVFLDGFGLGKAEKCNPLFTSGINVLEKISGKKLIQGIDIDKPGILFKGIDATLGMKGLPQSATGQTALFTGKNAPEILGYHLPAFPNDMLIKLIGECNILKELNDSGYRSTFANAYSDKYFDRAMVRGNTHSVTTHCMLAAGLPYRTMKDLMDNNAVYWDISRESILKDTNLDIKPVDSYIAGKHLAVIAREYEFVLFESFTTDLIGHKCENLLAKKTVEQLSSFFSGVLESIGNNTNLLICSDHGNIEDLSVGSHTDNPVPLIVIGPDARHFKHVERIDQVTPEILKLYPSRFPTPNLLY